MRTIENVLPAELEGLAAQKKRVLSPMWYPISTKEREREIITGGAFGLGDTADTPQTSAVSALLGTWASGSKNVLQRTPPGGAVRTGRRSRLSTAVVCLGLGLRRAGSRLGGERRSAAAAALVFGAAAQCGSAVPGGDRS